MPSNVVQKLIASHLVDGNLQVGEGIGIRIDQTLTQDATGTLVMLALEAMDLPYVRSKLSAQYVDHNLVQEDHKNPDDHLFLYSACRRFGVWYSRPGNGVSHPVHQERFGVPGATLLGSDSHTPAAGAIGMLAIGAGGLDVALAMAGEPYHIEMPAVWGVKLVGEMPEWVSAKDVILEMLRRHDVAGGVGRIIEYYGPGLASLSAMDRHVIANMGTELGATSTVFPSDHEVKRFLRSQSREQDWIELTADPGADYDVHEEIDLSQVEPLIAMPSSPGNVVPVREVAGQEIYQSYVGSSANPGYRDFAIVAEMVKGRSVHPRVSLDVNPSSRQILESLSRDGHLAELIHCGARIHQAGCNGCIGMGQAPATDKLSLRTVPRNFPGRSGTREDKVCLVSPETAAASALTGKITDPRDLGIPYPGVGEPERFVVNAEMLMRPLPEDRARAVELMKGPNVEAIPYLDPLPDEFQAPVLLRVGDNISTDEILPAGARVLPYRSNIPAISRFAFEQVDSRYVERAEDARETGHVIVGGWNYGQGSSREHAALAPRYLGLRMVIARSFARIHRQNLVNFGVLPVTFEDPEEYSRVELGDVLEVSELQARLGATGTGTITIRNTSRDRSFKAGVDLSSRQLEQIRAGGSFNWVRQKWDLKTSPAAASGSARP